MPETLDDQVAQLKNAVAALEAQREILGEAVVEAGLAPHNEITGGKVIRSRALKTHNRAGQACRQAAASATCTDCSFGAYYHRLKSRPGLAQAIRGACPQEPVLSAVKDCACRGPHIKVQSRAPGCQCS